MPSPILPSQWQFTFTTSSMSRRIASESQNGSSPTTRCWMPSLSIGLPTRELHHRERIGKARKQAVARLTRLTSQRSLWRSPCIRPRSTAHHGVGAREASATSFIGMKWTEGAISRRGSSLTSSLPSSERRSDRYADQSEAKEAILPPSPSPSSAAGSPLHPAARLSCRGQEDTDHFPEGG